jgi:hypothetical protein
LALICYRNQADNPAAVPLTVLNRRSNLGRRGAQHGCRDRRGAGSSTQARERGADDPEARPSTAA